MRFPKILFCSLAVTAMCVSTAQAQQERGPGAREGFQQRQRMAPEQSEAAWTWEARGVARELKLSDDLTTKLVDTYVASRKALNDKLAEMRRQRQAEDDTDDAGDDAPGIGADDERPRRGGFGRGDFQAMREATEQARDGFQSKVGWFLSAEHAKTASASLGTFSTQWDRMVHALVEMKLDESKMYEALVPLQKYVVALDEARTEAMEQQDFQAMREVMRETQQTLAADLEAVLGEEQFEQFRETAMRRGGRGGQRARGGQREDRPVEAAAPPSVAKAVIGQPAPGFTLADTAGQTHTLAQYKGRIVVLEWINPDCPVCRGAFASGKVAAMKKTLLELDPDLVHLAINTTHYMEPTQTAAYMKEHKVDSPALIDRDGKVGRLYAAKTTPHLFVIDAEGVLRYDGAIDDDDSRGSKGVAATNWAVQAVRQIVNGETVSPDSTKPYGCSVKYAPAG